MEGQNDPAKNKGTREWTKEKQRENKEQKDQNSGVDELNVFLF